MMPIVYILVIDLKFYERSTLVFSVKKKSHWVPPYYSTITQETTNLLPTIFYNK